MIIRRANTILYCAKWQETVNFYETGLQLPVLLRKDWFVEFALGSGAALSVADQSRATVDPAEGQGITISIRVDDAAVVHGQLAAAGLSPGAQRKSWGRDAFFIRDPEGTRLEFWS